MLYGGLRRSGVWWPGLKRSFRVDGKVIVLDLGLMGFRLKG